MIVWYVKISDKFFFMMFRLFTLNVKCIYDVRHYVIYSHYVVSRNVYQTLNF